jgi:hypothetical protein
MAALRKLTVLLAEDFGSGSLSLRSPLLRVSARTALESPT